MELNVLNEQGKTVAAADAVFGREYNEALVHQIVVLSRPMRVSARALSSRELRSTTPRRSPGVRRVRVVPVPV